MTEGRGGAWGHPFIASNATFFLFVKRNIFSPIKMQIILKRVATHFDCHQEDYMSEPLVNIKLDHRKKKRHEKTQVKKKRVKLEGMGLVECFNSLVFVV